MVGAEMDKVYPVRLRKLRGRALASFFSFRAEPDKLYPSRHQPYIRFIPFSNEKKAPFYLFRFKLFVYNLYVPCEQPKYAHVHSDEK